MKKIFAILISLLFVASVFGVATTMAQDAPYCETEYYKVSRDSVKVGETFTISLSTANWPYPLVKLGGLSIDEITLKIIENGGLPYRIGSVELVGIDYYGADGLIYSGLVLPCEMAVPGYPCWSALPDADWSDVEWVTWTFRAVTPGTLSLSNQICHYTETITVTPKSLPIDWIMKKFGLGKYKK